MGTEAFLGTSAHTPVRMFFGGMGIYFVEVHGTDTAMMGTGCTRSLSSGHCTRRAAGRFCLKNTISENIKKF